MNYRHKNTETDELSAINRKRTLIVITSILALLVLAVALIEAPPSAVVVVSIILFISLKKAAIRYNSLGKKKPDLMEH